MLARHLSNSVRALSFVALALPVACHSEASSTNSATPCTITPPVPPDWHLQATGTTFTDALGRQVFLRGVNAGGRSKFVPYVPFDYPDGGYADALDAYMARAASWGINVMRVPWTWAALEPVQGADDDDWLSRYDQLLDSAWAHGIWTIVDFHQDVYTQAFCGDGFPAWTLEGDAGAPAADCSAWQLEYVGDPQVAAAFDAFWANGSTVQTEYLAAWNVMLARYNGKPGVLGFEPFNEPSAGTANEQAFEATTLTDFYSAVVPQMNAAAPSSLVFVDPPGVNSATLTTSLGKPTGANVVFAPHYYPFVPADSDSQAASYLSVWTNVGRAWNVPVFLGEFGLSNTLPSNEPSLTMIFDALDALGLSGTEWEYSTSAEIWNGETDSIAEADGGLFPTGGAVQRPFARAVAGAGITQGWNAGSATFNLAYAADDGGVTEVVVPKGAFPAGMNLSATGACVDTTSAPGTVLVVPDSPGAKVTLQVRAK